MMQPPVVSDADAWVEYRIFFSQFSETTSRGKELEALAWIPVLEKEASKLIGGHHWHREGFRLKLVTNEKAAIIHAKDGDMFVASLSSLTLAEPHLMGRTKFSESLDDEWLIVWLLLDLSKRFSGLLISVVDNDGQFLLIEAALVLPRWLKPENSDHRVWIKGAFIHIIPRPSAANPSLPGKLDLLGALGVLRSGVATRADDMLQRTIRDRLTGMPNAELDLLHHATCILPIPVARLMLTDQSLVASAVQAFYLRDVDGMKVVSKMAHFDPRRNPSVLLRLRFTRLQYAQLARQSFPAPPAFTLPPPSSLDFRAADLGMKLTVGLEILAALAKPQHDDDLASIPSPALPVASGDAEWPDYLRLIRIHNAVSEEEAAHSFLRITRAALYKPDERKSEHYRLHAAERAITATSDGGELWKGSETRIADDPVEWMNVTAEMVEDLLARTERDMQEAEAKDSAATRPPHTAEDMAAKVKAFVDANSGLEGVEPRPLSTERGPVPPVPSAEQGGDVTIDPAKFLQALRSAIEFEGLDEELEGSSQDLSDGEDEDNDGNAGEHEGDREEEEEEEEEMRAYIAEMERQLQGTAMADTFERQQVETDAKTDVTNAERKYKPARSMENPQKEKDSDKTDDQGLPPVDLDLNLVKNLLDSIAGEHGLSGPASAMLASLSEKGRPAK